MWCLWPSKCICDVQHAECISFFSNGNKYNAGFIRTGRGKGRNWSQHAWFSLTASYTEFEEQLEDPKFCQMIMKVQSVREYVETKIEKAEKPITDAMVHIITPTRASFFNGITHFPLMPTYRSLNIWLVIIPHIRNWYLYTRRSGV